MKKQIRLITTEETYPLRQKILRAGLPLSECQFPGDYHQDAMHAGVVLDDQLVCIATVHPDPFPELALGRENHVFLRLRGMASDATVQGKGFGTDLLRWMMERLKAKYSDQNLVLWFNARVKAQIFYERLGFKVRGEVFDIPTAGPHCVMWKEYRQKESV